jgi:hypothetical protein
MAKTGFYQTNPVVEEVVSSQVETTSSTINNDTKVKSSFYRSNQEYEGVGNLWSMALLARIMVYAQGQLAAEELLVRYIMADTLVFESGSSYASALVAATAETVISVQKNGTQFATITFEAGSTEGVVVGATTFAAEDVLTIVAPASADATLASISITLAASRQSGS